MKAMGSMAAKATWPMERIGEPTVQMQIMSQEAREKRVSFLFLWDCVWVWDGPGAFTAFGWVHLPTTLFFPQARLTGLFGPALPPLPF